MTGSRSYTRLVGLALVMIGATLATGCTSALPAATDTATSSAAATSRSVISAADLNGTYRYTFTQEDAERAGNPEADIPGQFPRTNTITLKDGELEGGCFGADGGTYEIVGDRITFYSREYDDDLTGTLSIDDQGNLHLTPVPPFDPGAATECMSKPWTKIE